MQGSPEQTAAETQGLRGAHPLLWTYVSCPLVLLSLPASLAPPQDPKVCSLSRGLGLALTCSRAAPPHSLNRAHVARGGHPGHATVADRGWRRGVQAPLLRLLPVPEQAGRGEVRPRWTRAPAPPRRATYFSSSSWVLSFFFAPMVRDSNLFRSSSVRLRNFTEETRQLPEGDRDAGPTATPQTGPRGDEGSLCHQQSDTGWLSPVMPRPASFFSCRGTPPPTVSTVRV